MPPRAVEGNTWRVQEEQHGEAGTARANAVRREVSQNIRGLQTGQGAERSKSTRTSAQRGELGPTPAPAPGRRPRFYLPPKNGSFALWLLFFGKC